MTKFNIKEWQDGHLNKGSAKETLNEGFLAIIGGIVIGGMVLSAVANMTAKVLTNAKFSPERLTKVLNNRTKEIIKKSGIDSAGISKFKQSIQQPLQKMINAGSITTYNELESAMTELLMALKKK